MRHSEERRVAHSGDHESDDISERVRQLQADGALHVMPEWSAAALDRLVGMAYEQNLPLQTAGLRVHKARAILGVTVGNLYPQVQRASGSVSTIELSENAEPVSNLPGQVADAVDTNFQTYRLGFDAAWEIDGEGEMPRPAALSAGSVVTVRDNVPVLVGDVATVSLGPALRRGALDKEGVEAVGGVVVVRYGENPHQDAALYGDFAVSFEKLHGKELSYNNIVDLVAGVKLVGDFQEPCCGILKHTNPCGFGLGEGVTDLERALRCDPVSAFGSIVAVNGVVDVDLADASKEGFVEVMIARRFTEACRLRNLFGRRAGHVRVGTGILERRDRLVGAAQQVPAEAGGQDQQGDADRRHAAIESDRLVEPARRVEDQERQQLERHHHQERPGRPDRRPQAATDVHLF